MEKNKPWNQPFSLYVLGFFALGAAVTLSACSLPGWAGRVLQLASDQGATTTTLSNTYNACTLFPQSRAEEFMGMPLLKPHYEGMRVGGIITTSCTYASSEDEKTSTRIRLIVQKFDTEEDAKNNFDQSRLQLKELLKAEPETVADLGQEAVWAGGELNYLYILFHDRWFAVEMTNATDAKAIAEKAGDLVVNNSVTTTRITK